MKIYLVQHGIALSEEADPSRPLSPLGHTEVAQVAAQVAARLSVKTIYHSGKLRARQTAELLSAAVGKVALKEISGMNPNDDVARFASRMDTDDAMYVGHLPHLQKLAAYLLTGDENHAVLRFRNAAVTCLEQNERWQILWSIPPAS